MFEDRQSYFSLEGVVLVGLLAWGVSFLDNDECDVDDCIKVVAERIECTPGWSCSDGLPFVNSIACYKDLTGKRNAMITGAYGEQRGSKTHSGIDLGVVSGTDVHAAKEGVVEEVVKKYAEGDRSTPNGNFVRIQYDDGTVGFYLHLKSAVVNVGDSVDAGDLIGQSNDTGRSFGPHLHYTQYVDGTRKSTKNPMLVHSAC